MAMKSKVFEPMDMTVAEALLKEAKQILDQLGLAFFLRHGTCLGAVRDKAFIGWDDDLDIGSLIGMHGLTETKIREAAAVFYEHGYNTEVIDSELHLSVDLKKSGIQMDWTCYRIIDDSIYQWPVVKIPVSLYKEMKEIDFLGTKFCVPNPPEEYLTLKYGPDWMTPKKAGGFEQEVLDLMEETAAPTGSVGPMQLASELSSPNQTGSLKVIDIEGRPVPGVEIALAATTILTGLEKATTNKKGLVYFSLPEEACYVVAVKSGNQNEILYLEELVPGINYTYQPDPGNPSGRSNALVAEQA